MRFVRPTVLFFALMVALGCFGCFADPARDAKNKKKIENLLARLPKGWNATVEVKGDTLTVRNFRGLWAPDSAWAVFSLAFDLEVEGVNFAADETPGGASLFRKAELKNLRAAMTMAGIATVSDFGADFSYSLERLEINNATGDAAGLAAVLDETAEPEILLKTLNTWHCGPIRAEREVQDFSYNFVGVTSKTESTSLASARLFEYRDYQVKNVSVMAMGVEVVAVDSSGFKLLRLPDLAPFLEHLAAEDKKKTSADLTGDAGPPDAAEWARRELAGRLRAEPMRLEGLRLENLRVRPMTTDAMTLARFEGDFFFSPDALRLALVGKGLVVPASVLALAGPPRTFGLLPGEAYRSDQSLRWEMKSEGGGGEFALNAGLNLADRGLLEAEVNGEFQLSTPDFPSIPAAEAVMRLRASRLVLEDRGGIAKTLAVTDMRKEELLQHIATTPAHPISDAEMKFIEAVTLLLNQGGRVILSAQCDPPIPFKELDRLSESSPPGFIFRLEHMPRR